MRGAVRRTVRGGYPEQLSDMLAIVAAYRDRLADFEVAVTDASGDLEAYRRAGATWWLTQVPEISTRAEALTIIAAHRHDLT